MADALPSEAAPTRQSQRATLATTCGAHFVHDGIADSLYVLLPFWAQAYGLNYTQVGSIKTAYSAAMALLQTPAGLLAERLGERTLLALGTVLAGAAFAALAVAGSYAALLLLILVVGAGSAVQHPLASSVIARAYTAGPRRAALGVYNFAGDTGKMAVAFAVAAAAGTLGWQVSVTAYGLSRAPRRSPPPAPRVLPLAPTQPGGDSATPRAIRSYPPSTSSTAPDARPV
jgi:MFS family permease